MDKRLYRSRRNQILGGVCGGIAEYFDVDPTLVRLICLVVIIPSGMGILAYIIAWIIIPENPYEKGIASDVKSDNPGFESKEQKEAYQKSLYERRKRNTQIFGWILIILGLLYIGKQIMPWFSWRFIWPGLLVLLGVGLILEYRDKK